MKKLKIWSMLMLAIMTLSVVVACGGDDNENTNNGSITNDNIKVQLIGVWKTSMPSSNWKYIKLESNGTLIYSGSVKRLKEIINNPYIYSTKAFWSYTGRENTISMYTEDGYYAYTYKVSMTTDGNSWAGYDSMNNTKTYSFIKIKNLDDEDDDENGNSSNNHEQGDKQDFWIDFTLSNPGSLSVAAQARFVELKDSTIYGEKNIKVIEHPMYVTQEYAMNSFNSVAALPNEENDIVQKVMIPIAAFDGLADKSYIKKKDFSVTMILSKDSMKTVLATKIWNASEVIQ